jgi:hypothetical protein
MILFILCFYDNAKLNPLLGQHSADVVFPARKLGFINLNNSTRAPDLSLVLQQIAGTNLAHII